MSDFHHALRQLDQWVEREDFKGWDPYDALNSPLLKRLTFGRRRPGQLWVQLLKHSPFNFRPWLGISKQHNPKAMGLFLASYWRKYLMFEAAEHLERSIFFAEWLQAHVSVGYAGACWGYNFDWPNRGFFAPAGTPTIVNTAFVGLAFVDLLSTPASGRASWPDDSPLTLARSACEFIVSDLQVSRPALDELCFSYTPLDRRCIHNSNVLGALLLAEVAARTGESHLAELAQAATRYTIRRQRPDGSWPYGEDNDDGWVDNFHTGFVLSALHRLGQALNMTACVNCVELGYRYWNSNFFAPDGAPKYYSDRLYPIDAHSVAQAILTLLTFASHDSEAVALAHRTADWAIRNMVDPAGYFHYQIHRTHRIRIPYMRWSQAWMQRALTQLEWHNHHENLARSGQFAASPVLRAAG